MSLDIFHKAKKQAAYMNEAEPLCMVKGQLAVTYLFIPNFDESIKYFMVSTEKKKLNLILGVSVIELEVREFKDHS